MIGHSYLCWISPKEKSEFDRYTQIFAQAKITKQDHRQYLNCDHKTNNNSLFNFCPECGKKNNYGEYISTEEEFIDGFEGIDDSPIYGAITINNRVYEIIKPIDETEEWLYVKLYFGRRDGPRMHDSEITVKCHFSLEELVEMKNKMKQDLHNIWHDNKFGIYTLIDYRY